jgi:hypothetical protein
MNNNEEIKKLIDEAIEREKPSTEQEKEKLIRQINSVYWLWKKLAKIEKEIRK